MASYRLKLSDGTTTLDLYSATDYTVMEGGLSMPPPPLKTSYIYNPFKDGGNLASARYENRTIEIALKLSDTTLANLKTNIRAIQRLLNDAKERTLLGHGSQVYLEYQWGDTANQSTFFDVLHGDLILPRDYLKVGLTKFHIMPAILQLVCKPFGRYTNQTVAQATLENEDYSTNHNYMDITTAEAYGDAPARMYIKAVNASGTAANRKMWVAKRSGSRYDDDLWLQGEDSTSTTDVEGNTTYTDTSDATCSGSYRLHVVNNTGTPIAADTVIGRMNYSIATPPEGLFRVLIYSKTYCFAGDAEIDHVCWGVGWSYGSKTYTPSEANGDYYYQSAHSTWETLDLGLLRIPPIPKSDIAGTNAFELRIYQYIADSTNNTSPYVQWDLDYIFLLPIDEGCVIVNSVGQTDEIAIDGITDPPNVFKISSAKVTDYPDYVGAPFTLGRENTRIYMLREDVKGATFTVDITYQPQFLVI